MTLVSDSAIKGYQEDLLERKDFAYNIADIVAKRTENDAFTIGLMGAWGSGKSSVLNLIEERFQKCHRDMITIFFNPWRYSGEEELLM
ncbi:MAG: P-loop NTPase fold protein, partial [Acinetobacter tandoii]